MKVALVYSFEESSWFSCTIIVKNLVASYEKAFGKQNVTHINYSHKRFVKKSDLEELANADIQKVIFIDHKPTPVDFLLKLKNIGSKEPSIDRDYIIHVFGDFPLYLVEWRTVFELLDGRNVKFVCASEKQKNFVSKFFIQKNIQFVSPFPVNSEVFYFDEGIRTKFRKELGFNDEKVFIYTGRLSYQKRITDLIVAFADSLASGEIPSESKLIIVGKTDELGVPYLDKNFVVGEYFRSIDTTLESLGEYKKNITCTGLIENSELIKYYNASDVYVSLSTYHDEDYGMSVAEALSAGLPAIITNWAGYKSFQLKGHEDFCHLIPVELGEEIPKIDILKFKEKLKESITSEFDRSEIASVYHENFSFEFCASKLKQISDTKVPGFTETSSVMVSLTNEQFLRGLQIFKRQDTKTYNRKYFEVYDVYAE